MASEPSDQRTPPSGWESPLTAPAHRSAEELLMQLIDLFRQLLTVAQALLDLLSKRVQSGEQPAKPRDEVHDIPIL